MATDRSEHGLGPGEQAMRARNRRLYWLIGALFAAGLPIGFFGALLEQDNEGGLLTGTLPPWFAIAAAVVYVVAVTAGGLLRWKRIDELDQRDEILAAAVGCNLLLLVYPVWFLLWKGTLAGQPPHWMPFVLAFFGSLAAYLYLRIRH